MLYKEIPNLTLTLTNLVLIDISIRLLFDRPNIIEKIMTQLFIQHLESYICLVIYNNYSKCIIRIVYQLYMNKNGSNKISTNTVAKAALYNCTKPNPILIRLLFYK